MTATRQWHPHIDDAMQLVRDHLEVTYGATFDSQVRTSSVEFGAHGSGFMVDADLYPADEPGHDVENAPRSALRLGVYRDFGDVDLPDAMAYADDAATMLALVHDLAALPRFGWAEYAVVAVNRYERERRRREDAARVTLEHRFVVVVSECSHADAVKAITERLSGERELGFNYLIRWEQA